MTDITLILSIIVNLIAATAITFLIPWLKAKFSAEQLNKAKNLIKIAVQAAEMLFGSGTGDVKKKYVEDYILPQFAKAGLTFDADTINNMIESAVLELGSKI